MIKLTKKQFNSIHPDYAGTIDGTRTGYAVCIYNAAGIPCPDELKGTMLIIENEHFKIKE